MNVRVNAARDLGPFPSTWAYFGYDEPNYTYARDGAKLVRELASTSKSLVRFRTHHLLTTGDGTASLKFGSTNAYTEDSSGRPQYDWKIVDKILETYLSNGAKPFVEIGFMPQALSSKPEPYTPLFRSPADFKSYYLGWSYPPNDYKKWGELVYRWVRHSVEKYGPGEVASWNWEVWNEPDISYWHGTPDDYDKLYDYSADAVKRALPSAQVGGPASTSPRNGKAAEFLRQFLQHCERGANYATGVTGAPLDFITFHAKGSPDVSEGHVRMGISAEIHDAQAGFAIVHSFQRFRNLPIILTEADPEGCAACSSHDNPANAYRNGPLYPAYTAAAMNGISKLAEQMQVNLKGILTWAFEFEDKPYFAGYRDLATNGVDKPILNLFRMNGLMEGHRIPVDSDGALSVDSMLRSGVRERPVIDGVAARSESAISVLLWNYQDEDATAPDANVRLRFEGLPLQTERVLMKHYRIDHEHSNAFNVWNKLGSPEPPSAEQYRQIEAAGQLQMLDSPHWIAIQKGQTEIPFSLPLQGVSLVQLSW